MYGKKDSGIDNELGFMLLVNGCLDDEDDCEEDEDWDDEEYD